tara:strand:+ start:1402 stop:1635 length:234 start_codon:yes stop_codon:yes gene_type:complete
MKNLINDIDKVFKEILRTKKKININSNQKNIESWDSIAHIKILIALEKKFKIKFRTDEFNSLLSVKKIIDCLKKKIK